MKKLLTILSLCALGLTLLTCVGCTEDDNNLALSNHDKKLQAVTKEVQAKKTTDKALLLVSFGSTWDKPQATFKKVQEAFKKKFPDRDLYFAFTSEICMTRCAQKGWNYYAPKFYLEALGVAGYVGTPHQVRCVETELLCPCIQQRQEPLDRIWVRSSSTPSERNVSCRSQR